MLNVSIDLSTLIAKAPRECWVALNEEGNKLLGWGETIDEAMKKAKESGVDDPLMIWSPSENITRVLSLRCA